MSFVDVLRSARDSPISAYHEFKLRYDPARGDVHAFFEGREDVSFYRGFAESKTTARIWSYRCGSKGVVYETFSRLKGVRASGLRAVFFVDKDLSDVMGESWPVDPAIYVTDFYSIENYLVCEEILVRVIEELFSIKGVMFDADPILAQFTSSLDRFSRYMRTIMAWVVVVRRRGARPNLSNIDLGQVFRFSDDLVLRCVRSEGRLAYLGRACGVASTNQIWREVKLVSAYLRNLEAKIYLRGKFEAWFMISFVREVEKHVRSAAREVGGNLTIYTRLSQNNFVEILAPRLTMPRSLNSFLEANLPS